MSLNEKIEGVLEHFDYALVKLNGYDYDNVVVNTYPATKGIIKRYLLIKYGARVSVVKGGFKVVRNG